MRKGRAAALVLIAFAAITELNAVGMGQLNPILPFYIVVFFASWSLGSAVGLGCAFSAALVITTVNGVGYGLQAAHPRLLALAWNVAARIATFALLALLADALREVVERERRRAAIDPLTGVLNSKAFHERSSALVAAAAHAGRSIVLAYMDLDGFKKVNDRHGHSAGDRVLKAFAGGAVAAVRASDLFARFGGDEFVAMLAVPTCEDGDKMAERLHARLSGVLHATGFPVTCSMGAMVADAASLNGDEWLVEGADRLMYEVKRSGRNALRVARLDSLGHALRGAYDVPEVEQFADMLAALDRPHPARRAA